jgi:hypothetical protein
VCFYLLQLAHTNIRSQPSASVKTSYSSDGYLRFTQRKELLRTDLRSEGCRESPLTFVWDPVAAKYFGVPLGIWTVGLSIHPTMLEMKGFPADVLRSVIPHAD